MKHTGKVINIDKNKVFIVTKDKEFLTVKKNKIEPIVGQIYTGESKNPVSSTLKYIIFAISILIVFSAYTLFQSFSPKATIIAEMTDFNGKIKFEINKNNKIINVSSRNTTGLEIIDTTNVVGNYLNDGLIILFDNALSEKKLSIPDGHNFGQINIFISNNKFNDDVNLNEFIEHSEKNKFIVQINKNTGEF